MSNVEKGQGSDWEGFIRDAGERDSLDRAARVALRKKPLTFWASFFWAMLLWIPILFVFGVLTGWVRGEILGAWTHNRFAVVSNSVVIVVCVYLPCATVLAFITAIVGVIRSKNRQSPTGAEVRSTTLIPPLAIPVVTPIAEPLVGTVGESVKPTEPLSIPSVPLASAVPVSPIPVVSPFLEPSSGMATELSQLAELYRLGGLTEEEFTKAKAAVISGKSGVNSESTPNSSKFSRKWNIPWKSILTAGFLATAYFSNPDQASLEKICRENMEKNNAKAGMVEQIAASTLLDVSFERKNYYLFSVGTIRSRVRLVGPQVNIEVLGAFGRWWFELLDTPLYQKR